LVGWNVAVARLTNTCGTLPTMAPAHRRPDTSWLVTVVPTVQALLDRGEATTGFTVTKRGNHLILGRVDEDGPDPRFRLTALGGGRYGLSLYERNHWEPLPYEGTLAELVDVINTDLAMWAAEWPSLPPA
jgi:hypothetical protein